MAPLKEPPDDHDNEPEYVLLKAEAGFWCL